MTNENDQWEEDPQYWVALLFEVQTGYRSCRNMASLILESIEKAKQNGNKND